MGEFHIFGGGEIAIHPAFQCVAHGIDFVRPRARATHQFGIVATIGGALNGEFGIGGMFPNHAPVIHNLIVERFRCVGSSGSRMRANKTQHDGSHHAE